MLKTPGLLARKSQEIDTEYIERDWRKFQAAAVNDFHEKPQCWQKIGKREDDREWAMQQWTWRLRSMGTKCRGSRGKLNRRLRPGKQ